MHCDLSVAPSVTTPEAEDVAAIEAALRDNDPDSLYKYLAAGIGAMDFDRLRNCCTLLAEKAGTQAPLLGIDVLTRALDYRYATGSKKRSAVLTILRDALEKIFTKQPLFGKTGTVPSEREMPGTDPAALVPRSAGVSPAFPVSTSSTSSSQVACRRITLDTRDRLRAPREGEKTLLVDARGFEPQGQDCDGRLAVEAYGLGWRHIIHYNSRGTRFHAAGFGPKTDGLRVDCYDNPGDYLGSGMDGLEAYVHCNAQDQLGQIAKRGKMVIYGDAGQTFLYGAKGGSVYVMGNVAGRPLINAVGKPRVVINGTALDFLAESFMAGNRWKAAASSWSTESASIETEP